ncbi:MAG: Competence protein ComM [Syntrophorhabdaceae bacterium PtaU1.Bin034]|nr:MAG: Competence protein ComM [Syntrophorhabdaceae bacterium PtaU1.Bin034]
MTARMVKRYCTINGNAGDLLEKAVEKFGLSPRAYHKILKVARTIADLERCDRIDEPHVAEAIQYRVLDKRLTI